MFFSDCAITTWGGWGWETRGGGGGWDIGENHNWRVAELDVKLNTYDGGGGITFFTLSHKLEKW